MCLDFAKAFDKVDFLVTMRKLKEMGISGKLGPWIHAFLTNRKQHVVVDGRRTPSSDVKSGLPQGSVLGPLLFLVLIGDIDHDVASAFVSSFADDTRAGKGIATLQDVDDLQSDLSSIYHWAEDNNMDFNAKKFELMRYGPSNEVKNMSSYTTMTGEHIQEVEHTRDLGVIMSSSGTFKKHIQNTVLSANMMCGWVLRTFKTRHRTLMMTLWKSLVRSKMDYCCQLWSPNLTGDIQAIEQVQRSYVRKISGMQGMSYWQQLSALSLYSLERRRERYILLYVWRILEGLSPNFCDPEDGGIKVNWNNRRGRMCVVPAISRQASAAVQRLRGTSFAIRGPKLFNTLPRELRNMTGCSVESFKSQLDKYLRSVPDEPQVPGYTACRRADSNSLIHMAQFTSAQHVSQLEEPDNVSAAGGGHPWPPWV